MATRGLDGGGAIVTHPRHITPAPAVMAVLSRFDRDKISGAIEIMIALLDVVDGDPDLEPCGDDEPVRAEGDSGDVAWIEWHTMRGSQKRGPNVLAGQEDDEDDDPKEEDDDPGQNSEDEISSGAYSYGWWPRGAGCPLSDTGIADSGGLYEAHGCDGV